MRRVLIVFILFTLVICFKDVGGVSLPNAVHECGANEFWSERPYACGFKCTASGVEYKCERARRSPGCDCHFGYHLNMDTRKCEKINCKRMDCAGRANEMHFECESSRRDRCECTERITMDCNSGCMCKNGFCRVNGTCVKRECHHPVYS